LNPPPPGGNVTSIEDGASSHRPAVTYKHSRLMSAPSYTLRDALPATDAAVRRFGATPR
jgi:hypothetical protein